MKAYLLWLAKLVTLVFVFVVLVPILLGAVLAAHKSQTGEVAAVGNDQNQIA
ncbi:MAG: hypothetical protein GX589_08780, partial [Deltaproteobacteria bacterium]|nr:hypothetical protein [Deltaproteobacteria bacterium]